MPVASLRFVVDWKFNSAYNIILARRSATVDFITHAYLPYTCPQLFCDAIKTFALLDTLLPAGKRKVKDRKIIL